MENSYMFKFNNYLEPILCGICIFVLGFVLGDYYRLHDILVTKNILTDVEVTCKLPEPIAAVKEKKEENKAVVLAFREPEPVKVRKSNYDHRNFKMTLKTTTDVAELRQTVYPVEYQFDPLILKHKGGSKLNDLDMMQTIYSVVSKMPNIPHTTEVIDLIYETIIVETNVGGASYTYAAKNWHNYGIAQIREDTAEYLLQWLGDIRPEAKTAVMSYYDKKLSLKDNLLVNVPFSVAVAAQYYWHRVGDLQANILTLEDRAKVWKAFYNGPGAGTVNVYINRVIAHYKTIDTDAELLLAVNI